MTLKELIDRIKCKLFICCKSKCSLNDTDGDGIPDALEEGNEWIDELQEDIRDVVGAVQQAPLVQDKSKQYNYYSKKESI